MIPRFPFARKKTIPGAAAHAAAEARERDVRAAAASGEAPQVRDIAVGAGRYRLHRYPATHGLLVARAVDSSIASEVAGRVSFDSKVIAQIVAYVEALTPAGNVALTSLQAIDQYVQGWQELEQLSVAMLSFNGIDYVAQREEAERRMWSQVGTDLAIGFMSAVGQIQKDRLPEILEKMSGMKVNEQGEA